MIDESPERAEVQVILRAIESEVGMGEDGNTTICKALNGLYITLCWTPRGGIIKAEGESAAMFQTPELAWVLWLAAFDRYRTGREGKIYWRHRPQLYQASNGSGYMVVGRLLIGPNKGD